MLLNKSDLTTYTKLIGDNMPDNQVVPFIQDSETFDVSPTLPAGMFDDIVEKLPSPIVGWDRNETYSTTDIVFHNGKFWKAVLGNTDSEPAAGNTDWALHELLMFWLNFVKPYHAYNTISRWIVEHGRNGTQFGLTKQLANTFENWSDKERAEIKSSYDSRANHYAGLLRKELANKSYTFDGVTYEYECGDGKPKIKTKFWQVGSNDKKTDEWLLR